jgi:aminoglycoside 6'-N-acetyltransferase
VNPGLRPPAITFRPLARSDLPLLIDWPGRPHVAQWWREPCDVVAVEAAYGPLIDGSDPTEGFIALLGTAGEGEVGESGSQPLAFIQRYRFDQNPDWQRTVAHALGPGPGGSNLVGAAAGIDYLIGDQTMTGRGLGRQMISAFVDLAWSRFPDVSVVIVAVDQANKASWRALEGAAFQRAWGGVLDSDDPSDEGPSYLYVRHRPGR